MSDAERPGRRRRRGNLGVLGEFGAWEHAQDEPAIEMEQRDGAGRHFLVAGELAGDDALRLQPQPPIEGQRPLEVLDGQCDHMYPRFHSPSFLKR